MARNSTDQWNNQFPSLSPAYSLITPQLKALLQLPYWPTLDDYNQALGKLHIHNTSQKLITAVAQNYNPEKFDDLYETRIFKTGELQTRLANWHDFFNAAVWMSFPETKATLNVLHHKTASQREPGTNRSALENAIALFDECGAIIVVDDEKYKELIINHQWSTLFATHAEKFGTSIKCFIFGHAIYEKLLNPYIGMITQSIILLKEKHFFDQQEHMQLNLIDNELADLWKHMVITSPKSLQPFPVLGIPGWWSQQDTAFYDNTDYFRAKR